jgi:hypothetical protein
MAHHEKLCHMRRRFLRSSIEARETEIQILNDALDHVRDLIADYQKGDEEVLVAEGFCEPGKFDLERSLP